MLKNIAVSSISDPALATINIIAADEASGEGAAATKKKGLPMIVTPTEVTADMLGCPLINFGQSVYIDFGTGTTIDNIYACTSVSHTFSPGEFSTSAKFVINVGAYGIYNSTKRQLDLLTAQTQQANGTDAVSASAPNSKQKPVKWTDVSKNPSVTLNVLRDSRNSTGATYIRIWFDASPDANARKIVGTTDGTIPSNYDIATEASRSVEDIFSLTNLENLACYEINYPRKNKDKVKGIHYTRASPGVVNKQHVLVDLKTLPVS
jgi:hypothetical protein